jgi:ribosomal protein L12E/L44/L45/RPP1/RPP2
MSGTGRRAPLLERPAMREQFRKELRGRLMSEAVIVLAPKPRRPVLFATAWLRPALAAAVVAVVVLAGATSAAASSLPGDPLYGLKRVTEDVQLALTFDDVARMQLLSKLADRRLEELAEIARQRPSAAPTATAHYADAVDRFADAVDRLRDADSDEKRDAAQAVADAAREKHLPVLDAVKETLPAEARPDVQRVIEKEQERTTPSDRGRGGGKPDPRPTPKK